MKYNPIGGVFSFEVLVYDGFEQPDVYAFSISRTGYNKEEDDRVFFAGEIKKTGRDGTIRYGMARVVDRTN